MKQTELKKMQNEDEISLVDIIRFFKSHGKFLTLMTVVLSAISVALFLLQPKQYQKQLTLSVNPISVSRDLPFTRLDVNRASTLAVALLQKHPPTQTIAKPTYDTITQQINLTLESTAPSSLSGVGAKVVSNLETEFQKTLDAIIETSLVSTNLQLKRHQQVLSQLDQQIAQFPPTNTAKLEALETERTRYIAAIAALEFDIDYLEQSQKNPSEFAAQLFSVQVVAESEAQPTRSLKQVTMLAVIASFIAAVLAAIIREQIYRLRDELSGNKINTSQNV